jgi:hypothetical protein
MSRPTPATVEKLLMSYDGDQEQVVRHMVEEESLSENQARALACGAVAVETDESSALAPVVEISDERKAGPDDETRSDPLPAEPMSEHFRAVASLTPRQLSGMLGWTQQGQDGPVYIATADQAGTAA